ncbi:MAG: HAMP domain-containing histidine kinase [Candidatus Marinimicrobia bacterium]|nr:HAMP domain-containing histidine kinase [Candidatus Neomarinimicrobiota bacterium]
MSKEKLEIDNLVSQFASSANTLQQAYLSLENELLETYLPEIKEENIEDSKISESSIWEFRKNLIHVLDMMEQPVLLLNESMEIITKNKPAKIIYQLEDENLLTNEIFPMQSQNKLSEFIKSGRENKIEKLDINIPVNRKVKFELRRHIDNFTKGALVSVACIDERLLNSGQVKGKLQMQNMIGNLAHNIRTPMSAIVGYAQLLQRDLGENSKYTNKINFIFDGVQRIDRVITSLINYANEPTISSVIEYELATYLNQKQMIWSQEFNREIQLSIKTNKSNEIKTYLSKRGLDSILQNIILNSCEAITSKKVIINIDIIERESQLIIKLEDKGEGMTAENLAKCKEPFFTTRINGLGLGLSIVENLVLIMNGEIEIKSVLGEGTQIELIFPLENLN